SARDTNIPSNVASSSSSYDDDDIASFSILSAFGTSQTRNSRNIDELQFYLQKANEPKKNFLSLCMVERQCKKQFPVLAAITRDVLNVLTSTVASEKTHLAKKGNN
ncbi:hypothetical protein HAX54_003539, partial [Datura stramonium]|nr:hypothetical protein [Datura stramonium]